MQSKEWAFLGALAKLRKAVPALIRRCDDLPATITHVPVTAVLVLNTPDYGRLRPKHVEWPCRNKTCTALHQVGVSFDLYYDARKHKIKKKKLYRCDSVVTASFEGTGYTTRRWEWLLGRRGCSITYHYPYTHRKYSAVNNSTLVVWVLTVQACLKQ